MDEEIKAYLDKIVARMDDMTVRLDTMMGRMNNGFERTLDEVGSLKTDFQNTKGFLLEDASVMGRRSLFIEDWLSKLERKQP